MSPSKNGRTSGTGGGGARKRRSPRKAGAVHRESPHTSHPTSRAAYLETRRWLLKEHGPVCAYCARRYTPIEMTLDHVAPRKGQSAYDRRDNLVLACKACNAAKADMPLLSFLLRHRERAVSLAQYGVHLSPMLRDLILQIADGVVVNDPEEPADDASPYADVAYREPLRPYRLLQLDEEAAEVVGEPEAAPAPAKKRRSRRRRR